MDNYYNGGKLLSMTDINGLRPEVYLCTSNRTGGKTTFFNRLMINKFLKKCGKFGLIYRFSYELDDVADTFFKDIKELFFRNMKMESKKKAKGIYHELYLNDESCGYAFDLNHANSIKQKSHLFSDINRLLFDEFQSETNHYCTDEVKKLISIHTSIARGQGEQVRYVPLYMVGNPVTIINPYYVEMGISSRLHDDTRFLKGDGFVLEQGFVKSASESQKSSAFNRAFSTNEYVAYASQAVYLNDTKSFIEKPKTRGKYILTLKYLNSYFAVREYTEEGIIYCDDKPDMSFPIKITVTTVDHDINYVMLKRNDFTLTTLRFLFEKGCFRFKDLKCKDAILHALSY